MMIFQQTNVSLATLFICMLFPGNPAWAELVAGAAKVEITPELGVSLDGSISKNGPATSVHDPLHARRLCLATGAWNSPSSSWTNA